MYINIYLSGRLLKCLLVCSSLHIAFTQLYAQHYTQLYTIVASNLVSMVNNCLQSCFNGPTKDDGSLYFENQLEDGGSCILEFL